MYLKKETPVSVDELTGSIRKAIFSCGELQNIAVCGELMGFKKHSSGHSYFTILGRESRISCVLFRSNASSVLSWPKDGDEVLVRGSVDVYGARGSYQIYASTLLPIGAGAKARAKEQLKNKLAQEGFFAPEVKRPIPLFPERAAVITSPTGAALQDIIKISSIRYPVADIIVIPSLMQGFAAEQEIVDAFRLLSGVKNLSLIILARGGGSRDDLDIFDSEAVVRAVRSAAVPVITGLGHQIDFTLADMASDASAPTPSGAAERVFPDRREIYSQLESIKKSALYKLNFKIAKAADIVSSDKERLVYLCLKNKIEPSLDFAENSTLRMRRAVGHKIDIANASLSALAASLNGASPLNILSKGYSICRDSMGNMIKDAASLKLSDRISVQMRDGRASAVVDEITPGSGIKEF